MLFKKAEDTDPFQLTDSEYMRALIEKYASLDEENEPMATFDREILGDYFKISLLKVSNPKYGLTKLFIGFCRSKNKCLTLMISVPYEDSKTIPAHAMRLISLAYIR